MSLVVVEMCIFYTLIAWHATTDLAGYEVCIFLLHQSEIMFLIELEEVWIRLYALEYIINYLLEAIHFA